MPGKIQCVSPVDGSVYVERPTLTAATARAAVAQAAQAQPAWESTPLAQRIALVLAGVKRLGEMNAQITTELAWQMGRPVRYGGEFSGVNERATYMAGIAEEALAPIVIEDSAAFFRRIERRPVGVVLVVAPWNYPFLTAINTIVPALIAGNAVILKHSSQTPLAGERLAGAFHAAGVPEAIFQNLVLDHATTATLISEKSFGFINFTGSVPGGKAIEQAAAGTFTAIGTELGGKDPGYVMEDADLDAAVATLIDGAMYNSGQCCCGIERIYVCETHFDAFVEKAVNLVEQYKLGNPLEQETTLGPMANLRFANEVRAQVDEAIAAGARPLVNPGLFPQDGGAYLMPQLLIDVDHSMRIMREESFGPVVGIMQVKDDAEAIALMNDSDFGLTASLWTRDSERALRIARSLQTGTVYMNRCDYLDPALCWTGCKDTGRGGSLSVIAYHNLTRPMSFHFKKGQA
jgi:acyl-CoA reductase-like NAD-dependent aldehyde dehydrogenase